MVPRNQHIAAEHDRVIDQNTRSSDTWYPKKHNRGICLLRDNFGLPRKVVEEGWVSSRLHYSTSSAPAS